MIYLALATCLALATSPGISVAQAANTAPPAQVAISPPRVEVDLDAGRSTEAVHVINLSDQETRISVSVVHWDLDENNKVRDLPPTEQSLDQWIVINPLEFTIPPQDQQTIRFAVRPRVEPEPGEHRAMIYFEQGTAPADADAGAVSVRYRLGVAVYGLSGHIDRRGRIEAIRHTGSGEDHYLDIDTLSEGNASVRLTGQFGIWQAADFPGTEAAAALLNRPTEPTDNVLGTIGVLPEIPVLPGTQRTIRVRLPALSATASYVVYVAGEFAGRSFTEQLEIEQPEVSTP
jgi:P pilus assembly chaperone PapD